MTKDEILNKRSLVYYMSEETEVEGKASDVYDAMDEYAKEIAIGFGKLLNIDYTDKDSNGAWLGENQWRKTNTDDIFTTEQLYNLYLQSLNPINK